MTSGSTGRYRTIVYIDGFNFYYGAVRGTPWKWLDPVALFEKVLGPKNDLVKVDYFTARVQPSPSDPNVDVRQHVDFVRPVRTWMLKTSQLPDPIPGTAIHKPARW